MAGGTPLGNMVIELELDSTKLKDGLTRINNQLKSFERQVKAQNGIAKFYKKGTEAVKAYAKQKRALTEAYRSQGQALQLLNGKYEKSINDTKKVNKEARELEKAIKDLEKRYHESVAKTGEASEASQKLGIELQQLKDKKEEVIEKTGRMATASQRLAGQIELGNAKLASYASQLKEVARQSYLAESKMYQFGQKLAPVGQFFNRTSTALDVVSQKTRGMSLAIAAGMGLSVKAAIDFESAFTGVTKTVEEQRDANGRVVYSYDQLRTGIRQLAKEIPATTTEISNVAEAAGQLGIQAPNIVEFSKTMIALGESTNLSATEAATALAKFRNITQMSERDFGRLGSVIVDLGNNMATTEKDITEMGLRLASTGKLVGLSEAQIMALAATLSAVGMEAEAGGSAVSRVMQKINTAVGSGGEKLEGFAKVAGLSAEAFSKSWKENPTEAIKAFVKGLGRVKETGGDVTQTLKDLGVNSIREIDSLQRLAGAGDQLEKAFGRANEAWKRNTALTDEANKRYGTMESKLKVFRNKLADIAITLGGPLLDALSDGLNAAEPYIKSLADMAKGFSSMDKASQRSIIKMGLFLAAISPVSKALSGLTGFIGSGVTGLSNFSKWLGKLGSERAAAKAVEELAGMSLEAGTNMTGLATATAGTTSQLGLLAQASAFISNPAVLVAGGLAIAGGLAYWAMKAGEAEARTKEWGTAVSATEADALSRFKTKVDQTNEAMALFEQGAGKVETVKKAFDELAGSIEKLANDELTKDLNIAKKFGLSDNVMETLKSRSQAVVDNVNGMSKQVKDIYDRHNGDVSQLTQAEKELVLRNQNAMIQEQLRLMDFSAKERKTLTKVLNGELNELNLTQLNKALSNTSKMIEDENKTYRQKKKELKDVLEEYGNDVSKLSLKELEARREVQSQLEALETEHNLKTKALKDQWVNIQRERVAKLRESGKEQELIQFELETITQALAKEMGISYEEASKLLSQSVDNSTQKLGILSNNTKNATAEVARANEAWDSLFTSANPQESLSQLLSTAEGWNDFELMVKHADVNPIGRAALAEMLVAGGQWQEMTLEQKMLVVDGQQAMIEVFDSKELLEQWQALTPEQKQLLAQNLTAEPTLSAQEALDSVRQKEPASINAKDETSKEVDKAKTSVNSPKQLAPVSMLGRDDTAESVAKVNASVNSPRQLSPISMLGRNDTAPAVAQANQAVNSPRQKSPAAINATNYASGPAQQAKWDLLSIPTSITSTITTFVQKIFRNETGTDFHPGGLAMVNDQKGSLYKELVTLPSGEHFIPEGRNVILPLPRGSKVLTASRTKSLMERLGVPKYAQGVGIPEDAKIFRDMAKAERQLSSSHLVQQDNSTVEALLREIIRLLATQEGQRENFDVTVRLGNMTLRDLTTEITKIQDSQRRKQFNPSYT